MLTKSMGTAANNKETDSVYGFNSAAAVPASEKTIGVDNTVTTTPGTTDTNTRTYTNRQDQNVESFNDRKNTEVKSFEDRLTHRELDRSGNIGTVTAQDMAKQELELWQWNFWLQVFEDLDSTICLDCY